jgi:ABC-2 type transport system permease protein
MSARMTFATAWRVLRQIRHDPRTVVMLIGVPCFLLVLLRYVFNGIPEAFQQIGAPLCGLFPFIMMFVVTSITMLRERMTGTLERLMSLPIAKLDLIAGYGVAFGILAVIQAAAVCLVGFVALGLDAAHGAWLVGILAVANATLGMTLGLLASAFARTEFQAVQFMPAFVLPQLLLCGLITPRSTMAMWLQDLARAMPLTYAYGALQRATEPGSMGRTLVVDVVVVLAMTFGALCLGALTLRRRTV